MAETVKKVSAKPKAPAKPRKTASTKAIGNGASNNVNGHATSNVTEIRFSYEQVAQLAHRYWAERGHRDGHHLEDWFRAEQELRSKAS
jgi:Protein of unknown function (DUF2934)